MMDLPRPLDKLFWDEILQYEEEKRMPFMTTPERLGLERGLLEGIEALLTVRFGPEGLKQLPEIRGLPDVESIRRTLHAIETAASSEEVRRSWAPAEDSPTPGAGS
jgi:hypothetical protein